MRAGVERYEQPKRNEPESLARADPNACGNLIAESYFLHRDRLQRHAYRMVRNWEDAEDIVQEAFVRLFSVGDIKGIRSIEAFLLTATHRLAIDYLRKRNRMPLNCTYNEEAVKVADASPHAETHCALRQELLILFEKVEQLPRQRRRAFKLRKFDGLSYKEIADIMSVTVGSVRKHLSAALDDCRTHLAQFR